MINTHYQSADDNYYNSRKERIVSLVPRGKNKVLDIGCGSGKLGEQLLLEKRALEVVGVEIFHPAATKAGKVYSRIIEGDIEKIEINYSGYFDYVICGDILEHLRDPWALVERIYGWLGDKGFLMISIPNIRYFGVIWDLVIRGKWEYTDAGILDETHLRFFTRHSLMKLIMENKFDLLECKMTIHGKKKELLNRLTLRVFEDFLGYQILAIASKNRRLF